ncbi:unnamed protein product [Ectocarpus sp. 6 AP-2014]
MRGSRIGNGAKTALTTNISRFATIPGPRSPHLPPIMPPLTSPSGSFWLPSSCPNPYPTPLQPQPLLPTLYRFEATKGGKVTAEDLANEDLDDEDVKAVSSESQSSTNGGGKGTPKRKGKGKVKAARLDACQKLVGAGVRKYFPRYDEEFDGEVLSYLPPESDDEHGDLWLIKYEDGDSEHFEPDELAEARALYNKRHALAKKVVTFPTKALFGGQAVTNLSLRKINVFGETPVGPRGVFCTIRGYRRSKSKGKS